MGQRDKHEGTPRTVARLLSAAQVPQAERVPPTLSSLCSADLQSRGGQSDLVFQIRKTEAPGEGGTAQHGIGGV